MGTQSVAAYPNPNGTEAPGPSFGRRQRATSARVGHTTRVAFADDAADPKNPPRRMRPATATAREGGGGGGGGGGVAGGGGVGGGGGVLGVSNFRSVPQHSAARPASGRRPSSSYAVARALKVK